MGVSSAGMEDSVIKLELATAMVDVRIRALAATTRT
jgi:hypothetical protein